MPSSADAQPKIVKNSLFGLVGQAAGGLLAFAAFVLIARQLGVQRFGILSFLVAFTSVFQLGATLGLVNILIREISQQRERVASIMGRAIPLVALLSLVVLGAMFAAIGALDLDELMSAHQLGGGHENAHRHGGIPQTDWKQKTGQRYSECRRRKPSTIRTANMEK